MIITDSKAAYKKVSEDLGCDLMQIPSGKHIKGNYNLGVINNYHGQLKTWIKHLDGYLAGFRFMKYLGYQYLFDK